MTKSYGKEKVKWREMDPMGRGVQLTEDAYTHIKRCHPFEAVLVETARQVVRNPISIWKDNDTKSNTWYYFDELEQERSKLLGFKNHI